MPGPLSSRWRWFAIALAACALAAAGGLALAPWTAGLFLFLLLSIPTNSLLPIPHEPGLLYFARFYPPLLVTAAGLIGAGIACTTDYALVEAALTHPRVERARDSRIGRFAVTSFNRRPFFTVLLFSALPLPSHLVRVLAPAAGYPFARYLAATVLGRLPAFWLEAELGNAFAIPGWLLLAMLLVMVSVAFFATRSGERRPAGEY
jgi:membrane protein YqaA with SNARE-associated domain